MADDGKRLLACDCRWSCVGELANFWKGSLRENWCQSYFTGRMTGAILVLVKVQKGNRISFVESIIIPVRLSLFRGSQKSIREDFGV